MFLVNSWQFLLALAFTSFMLDADPGEIYEGKCKEQEVVFRGTDVAHGTRGCTYRTH